MAIGNTSLVDQPPPQCNTTSCTCFNRHNYLWNCHQAVALPIYRMLVISSDNPKGNYAKLSDKLARFFVGL